MGVHVSFLADSGNGSAAEWEPRYGPIQIWTQCEEDWTGTCDLGGTIKSRSHWHFPFVQGYQMNWSQLAVDREGLKELLRDGNIDGIFNVLERWSTH